MDLRLDGRPVPKGWKVRRSHRVAPACPDQIEPAFRLIFRHLPALDREQRTATALELIRRGELDPAGILVVPEDADCRGAMVSMTVPGASGLVWPPVVGNGSECEEIEDQLVRTACSWLRQRGVKLAQALLAPSDTDLAKPLVRNGFRRITTLISMRHMLSLPVEVQFARQKLTYRNYLLCNQDLFHQTLLRSYEQTLDCPELSGARSLEEVLESHRAQGIYNPMQWWLALAGEQPVGVLVMCEMVEWQSLDVAYVGIVPEARGRGHGRELVQFALREASAAAVEQLTLCVDERNQPALNLYRSLGFEAHDRRDVYLAVWAKA